MWFTKPPAPLTTLLKLRCRWRFRVQRETTSPRFYQNFATTCSMNGSGTDLASVIAAAINPLLQAQWDEQRVNELIVARVDSSRGACALV